MNESMFYLHPIKQFRFTRRENYIFWVMHESMFYLHPIKQFRFHDKRRLERDTCVVAIFCSLQFCVSDILYLSQQCTLETHLSNIYRLNCRVIYCVNIIHANIKLLVSSGNYFVKQFWQNWFSASVMVISLECLLTFALLAAGLNQIAC